MAAADSSSSCLLGLGCDCAVYFLHTPEENTSIVGSKRGRGSKSKVGKPTPISNATEEGSWWLGRVQRIRRRVGTKWGLSRQPVDLMNKPSVAARTASGGPVIMVLLNWFSKSTGNLKFKYDTSDTNWIDVGSIISTCTLAYEQSTNLYWLDHRDAESLDEFVGNKRK